MPAGDRLLSASALIASAVLGWNVIQGGSAARIDTPLPYVLNNPGGLKKPALDAAALPTWMETGLIVFPSTTMGWAALRHQVRLMLTGASRVYRPTDTLLGVAVKYADGDERWGGNVAARLGIHPEATLAELARSSSP